METADQIYAAVLTAMQEAEELGGPEGSAYVALMEKIATVAASRAAIARANMQDA